MSKEYTYIPKGACCTRLDITLQAGRIENINIHGGCDGNLQGIARLITGMDARDAIERMEGISCSGRPTSCPDQIARALKEMLKKTEAEHAAK